MEEKSAEITFPCPWEYRVFSQVSVVSDVESGIRQIVEKMALNKMQLEAGAVSGKGSYRALRLTVEVNSKEEANLLGEEIKKLSGVRFIL